MANRDVSISLLGVVAGVILGAGSLAWAQTGALDATVIGLVPQNMRPANWEILNERAINKMGIPLRSNSDVNSFSTVKPADTPSSIPTDAMTVVTPCTAVRSAVAKVMETYNAVTPINVKNTEVRQRMSVIFAAVVSDACKDEVAASSASSAATGMTNNGKIQNWCNRYPVRSIRYSQCVINTDIGKTYP
ncbi:hypothetical protein EXS70_02230 [Candidatus Peribacteria bacterium]|nr:hypothetical protein [Candidatus Peribacteria bacterium]